MLEIERKYLVEQDIDFEEICSSSVEICQGYISDNPDRTVRVRLYGDEAFLTVKSRNTGAVRNEWEYRIQVEDARQMLTLPGVKVLEKTRHIVNYKGKRWEVDVFGGRHKGLIIAEIELVDPDEEFDLPPFVGKEVTGDTHYYNSVLVNS